MGGGAQLHIYIYTQYLHTVFHEGTMTQHSHGMALKENVNRKTVAFLVKQYITLSFIPFKCCVKYWPEDGAIVYQTVRQRIASDCLGIQRALVFLALKYVLFLR